MNYFRGALSAVFALFLAGGISAARADTAVIEELSQAQFIADFGSTTGTFSSLSTPGNITGPLGTFMLGSVTYSDQGNGALYAAATGQGFDIGTEPDTVLVDGFTGGSVTPNINMLFASPVGAVGLIAGDNAASGDAAIFNVTFGAGSPENDIGNGGSLPITGGDTPTYFGIFDSGGNGITQVNFSDNGLNPTLDTVLTATPEPSFVGLVAISMLALLGIYSIIRKRKNVAAHLGSGAAPLALLAVVALLAVPSGSFAQSTNCSLAVPNNPLTAVGLATPYVLSTTPGYIGTCSQASATMAFVQAAIYDPGTSTISVYTPLVVDAPPSTPGLHKPTYAISPVVPKLPANAVVAIWFGYNFDNLTLTGTAVTNNTCFTGFGQFAACNTSAFWAAVNADTTLLKNIYNAFQGQTGKDGQACPTSRSFSIVDQDPNDNLPVNFLLTSEIPPRVAQNTAANRAKLAGPLNMPVGTGPGYTVEINPSDEAVVDIFIDGSLGCNPPMVADLTEPGMTHASYAVNELFAGLESGQFLSRSVGTSIYGIGSKPLIGPGLVAIGDTFTLTPTFMQPNALPNCNYPSSTGGCIYPYNSADQAAFDAYVAAMGYSGATSGTISGTLSCATGSAFARTNQYRMAANQPQADCTATQNAAGAPGDASVQTFCKQMFTRNGADNSPADLLFNEDWSYFDQATNGPFGGNLFQFLGNRFAATYDLLGCAAVFGQANPVNVNNVGTTTPTTPGTAAPASPYYYPAVFPPPAPAPAPAPAE